MKRIVGWAVIAILLAATPLLAKRVEKNEYGRGKTLFRNICQFCHGVRGDGKGPAAQPLLGHPVDFTNSEFWRGDAENKIEQAVKKGKEMMPAFNLSPDEIKDVTRYISQTFKKAAPNMDRRGNKE